jgi:hypothetical protein
MMATSATSFRQGDWLCSNPACGAHNFARNMLCIVCGANRVRSIPHPLRAVNTYPHMQYHPDQPSPASTMSIGIGANAAVGGIVNSGMTALGPRRMGSGAFGVPPPFIPSPSASTFSNISRQASMNLQAHTTVGEDGLGMNDASIEALGGIGQVAAIREAIKVHQSQSQASRNLHHQNINMAQSSPVARSKAKGSPYGDFVNPFAAHQTGQLLIPTTLGNASPIQGAYGPVGHSSVQESQLRGVTGRGATHEMKANPAYFPANGSGVGHQGDSFGLPATHRQGPPLRTLGTSFIPSQPGSAASFASVGQMPSNGISNVMNPFASPISPASASSFNLAAKIPPVLTPSGRSFAMGGRVQNISRDESNHVIMFWPDNEPLPLPSQIRPPTAVLMALGGINGPPPPILNTGNKGPIDAQPGDWTCGKCDYLVRCVSMESTQRLTVVV